MIDVTKLYLFIFGALTIAGGVSGLLLLTAGYLLATGKVQPGLILGLVVAVALAARFVPAFLSTHKFMPAGMMALLSVAGIVITVLGFVKK